MCSKKKNSNKYVAESEKKAILTFIEKGHFMLAQNCQTNLFYLLLTYIL